MLGLELVIDVGLWHRMPSIYSIYNWGNFPVFGPNTTLAIFSGLISRKIPMTAISVRKLVRVHFTI